MRTIDFRVSHSGLEPVVPELSIDAFFAAIVVQLGKRFDPDVVIIEDSKLNTNVRKGCYLSLSHSLYQQRLNDRKGSEAVVK